MSDKNYFKNIVESRNSLRSQKISDELAEREVFTIFKLLRYFYNKIYDDQKNIVVDIGCGDKYLKKFFEKRNFNYIGYDLDDLDIEKDKIPLEDNSVDIIINIGLLEALQTYNNLFIEAKRVLKPDGFIYTITPNWLKDYKNFYNNPIHKKPYTPNSLKQAYLINGFKEINILPGLRCKPIWYYKGALKFEKAFYLLPFNRYEFFEKRIYTKNLWRKLIPEFLKGHSRSLIGIARK